MTQLAAHLNSAVHASMVEIRETMDFAIATEAVTLHFDATTVPADGKPDKRSTVQIGYAIALGRGRIELKSIALAADRLLESSLSDSFLQWSTTFVRENPGIETKEVADRLSEIMLFISMRSLTQTEHTLDQLYEREEQARVGMERELAKCRETIAKAKDRMRAAQGRYDEAGRRRCWLSAATCEIDALTLRVGDDVRKAVVFAWRRRLQRDKYPSRVRRKDKTETKTESVTVPQQDNGEPK